MDEPSSNGMVPDAVDDHSAVMTMLASESWQQRLDQARAAREALLAQRGVTQDLKSRLKSVAPDPAGPRRPGRVSERPGRASPDPDAPGADDAEAEEEFPEFFPEPDDEPVVVHQTPAAPPDPWAHVPPVGPARAAEPAHPAKSAAVAAEPAPLRRRLRIAAGFGLGLVAGVAATSLVWVMNGRTDGSVALTEAAASSAPAVVPQTAALSPPDATPPIIRVSAVSHPPEVASVLAGATGQPALAPDGLDIPKIAPLARLSGPSDLPVNPTPPAADARHVTDHVPAPQPAMLASVPDLSFAEPLEKTAVLPAAFAHPAPQKGTAWVGTGRPDPAPRAIDPPPGEPQIRLPDPAVVLVAPAVPPPPPETTSHDLGPHQVNVMAPESVADAEVTATIAGLQDGGFRLGENDRVPFKVSKSHVRFYHDGDRSVAEALAARIGGEARDFTSSDVTPPEGLIELWLQGSGPTVAAAKPAKKAARPQTARAAPKVRKAPSEDKVMKNLRDKIVRQLQKGEHL